jgi:hypothetical protein
MIMFDTLEKQAGYHPIIPQHAKRRLRRCCSDPSRQTQAWLGRGGTGNQKWLENVLLINDLFH